MSRIAPLSLDALDAETRARVETGAAMMGFTPNDALVMARQPALLAAMAQLVEAVYGPGRVDPGLKRLVGEAASKAAGCYYCSAHAAHGARNQGVMAEKIAAVWAAEDSPLFTEAERAAIALASLAGRAAQEVTDAEVDRLRSWFDADQIVEIVSVIAMFGFLNRWNLTLATALEPEPAQSAADLDSH